MYGFSLQEKIIVYHTIFKLVCYRDMVANFKNLKNNIPPDCTTIFYIKLDIICYWELEFHMSRQVHIMQRTWFFFMFRLFFSHMIGHIPVKACVLTHHAEYNLGLWVKEGTVSIKDSQEYKLSIVLARLFICARKSISNNCIFVAPREYGNPQI